MKTFIALLVLLFGLTTQVHAQSSMNATSSTISKNRDCMRFVADWADKCGDFGPIKLTHDQQKRKMDRCSDVSLAYLRLLPDTDPNSAEKVVDKLDQCVRGPNTASDLGVPPPTWTLVIVTAMGYGGTASAATSTVPGYTSDKACEASADYALKEQAARTYCVVVQ